MNAMIGVPGGALWVEDSEGGGRPVVFVHPGWADSAAWDSVLAELPGGIRVVRFDMRGYGRSPAPTVEFTWYGDLVAVLDELRLSDPLLVAHSGGGAAALCLAVTQPERVSSLVLVAPGVSGYPWPTDDPYFTQFASLFEAGDRLGLVELAMQAWAAAGSDASIERQVTAAVQSMFTTMRFLKPDPSVIDQLSGLRSQVDILIGDRECHLVTGCVDVAAARIPNCSVRIVAGADHMLPMRAPIAVADAVMAQLSQGPAVSIPPVCGPPTAV